MHFIGDMPIRNAKMYPDKEAIIFEDKRLTFKTLNEDINSLSNSLLDKIGVKPGDRAALLLKNCHQLIVIYFATQKIGAIFTPLNYRLTFDELVFMLNDCRANTLFFSKEFIDFYDIAIKKCSDLKNHILIDGDTRDALFNYEDLISSRLKKEPDIKIDGKTDSAILYTSGSTGRPKGVILTHDNLVSNSINTVIEGDTREEDITLNFLPLLASIPEQFLPHFYVGATNVILKEFDPIKIFETIQKEKVTHFDAVPTMYIVLLESPEIEKYDLDSLRIVMFGSAPMPIEVIKEFMKRFPGVSLIQGYGLTEAGVAVAFLKPKDQVRKIGSIGREIINVDVRIVDENGKDVPTSEKGELICKSRAVMKGYYNLPEETRATLKNGWLYSGDLAKRDEEGYIYLVGRKKDIIKSGGFGIAPAEVEEVLYRHPSVKEAAVFGIPHFKWGEAVHAVVAPKEGTTLTAEEIIVFCKDKMAGFKRPRSVEIIKELPKGTFGKIDKKILRDKYWEKEQQ